MILMVEQFDIGACCKRFLASSEYNRSNGSILIELLKGMVLVLEKLPA